ncbi:MAG: hypothetical protein L0177_11120, partial [Chloroflexi bacterium]|nr:hypothetical protein [Chloroflexota bacterium]
YIAAALLALAFATKETAYLMTFVLGLYLVLLVLPANLAEIRRRLFPTLGLVEDGAERSRHAAIEGAPLPVAAWQLASEGRLALQHALKFHGLSRPAAFLLLMVTLTLPQWSASIGLFQDTFLLRWTNLVFASPDGAGSPTGSALGGAMVIGGVIVLALLALSIYWGARWNWRVWWRAALIFYAIWVLLYTTFFTNMAGVGTGMWQSLGYWIAQQEVARGGQPWYYYFVIGSVYEFLPLAFGIIAAIYYARRSDAFGLFLVFWAVATFILYTIASEKMPWLLVNVALPIIVLAGKFLGETIERIEWRRVLSSGAERARHQRDAQVEPDRAVSLPQDQHILARPERLSEPAPQQPPAVLGRGRAAVLVPGARLILLQTLRPRHRHVPRIIVLLAAVPLFIFLLWRLAFFESGDNAALNVIVPLALAVALVGVAAGGVFLARRVGARNFAALSAIPVAAILLALTVRAGATAAYQNGDTPVEMLVFTQTSPDITRLLGDIEDVRETNGSLPIFVDDTSGFTWPWAWYLRHYDGVSYTPYRSGSTPTQPIVMVHSQYLSDAREALIGAGYEGGERIRHRWWFPEETYRGLTPAKFFGGFFDRDAWRAAMDYFLRREGVRDRIGSEDAYLYYSSALPIDYRSSE